MQNQRSDIISQLQKEILALQGFKTLKAGILIDNGLGPINAAFPNNIFPTGAIHEFICNGAENMAATSGFMSGLIGSIMKNAGAAAWISSSRILFPPALKHFGIEPDRIIFIDLKKEKDILWAMDEALKCEALSAVVAEIQEISFTTSRRLQLAVEQSRVTGFILRRNPRSLNTTACVSRWKVSSLPSVTEEDLPGIGFPVWNVELLKIRNGKPGSWQIQWVNESFRHFFKMAALVVEQQKKTG